jgi:selenocysteine lyase/cysteine desulfurase
MSVESSRREFLAAIGAAPLIAVEWPRLGHGIGGTHVALESKLTESEEYLFAPGLVYLNTASLGPCSRRVLDETQNAWYTLEANPVVMGYGEGTTLVAAERVRQLAASFLGCDTEEVVLTRSTTDGMNAVAQGLRLGDGDRVLTTDQEHEGGMSCWLYLAKNHNVGLDTVEIPPTEHDPARIVERFAAALTPRTRLISVSHVLSSTGLRMPIAEISALARSRDLLCIVDGAQSAGGIEVNVKALGCHAYATSGHKWLMGPKGTGLLYLAQGTEELIKPMQFGEGRTYYNHSSGVGNMPGVIGLGVALNSLQAAGLAAVEQHNLTLRNRLYEQLTQFPQVSVVSAPPGVAASQLLTFSLPSDIESQLLTKTLREKHKIIVKTVPKRWMNGLRLSPHIFNTETDVDHALDALHAELQ